MIPHGRTYAATPDTIADARTYVADLFAGHPNADDATLLASELATNATRHGTGDTYTIHATYPPGLIRITVTNTGGGPLATPTIGNDTDEGGRGLGFVALLAADWGHTRNGDTTTVWFDFPYLHETALAA